MHSDNIQSTSTGYHIPAAFCSLDGPIVVSSSAGQMSRAGAPAKESPSGWNHRGKGRGAKTCATVGRKPVPQPRACGLSRDQGHVDLRRSGREARRQGQHALTRAVVFGDDGGGSWR
jgi:hypothetical protein